MLELSEPPTAEGRPYVTAHRRLQAPSPDHSTRGGPGPGRRGRRDRRTASANLLLVRRFGVALSPPKAAEAQGGDMVAKRNITYAALVVAALVLTT